MNKNETNLINVDDIIPKIVNFSDDKAEKTIKYN